MKAMSFFGGAGKTEKGSVMAIFDIASSSVGGLLLKKRTSQPSEVLLSVRQDVVFDECTGFSARWRVFLEAFDMVSKHLKSDFPSDIDAVLCVFSCPWYMSQTKLVKIQREKFFEVKKGMIKALIEEESDVFKKQWRVSSRSDSGSDVALFERKPIKVLLNGYEVESPLDKFARSVEFYVYLSLGLEPVGENIREVIRKYLKTDKIIFHTFPLVAFSVLKKILDTNEGFILADISGELMDIFLMRNGVIEEVNCFNKGENFFIRRLASALNASFAEAKAVFRQYQRAELAPERSQKVGDVLRPAADEWARSLKELLKKMSADRLLPQNFYFCGSTGSLREITGHVSGGDFSSFTILSKPFTVRFLEPDIFKDSFDFAKGFSDNKDITLLMSSFFADKFVKLN